MAKRKIVWSNTAYIQRKKILIYWIELNKSNTYSIKLLQQTKEATKLLSEFPEIGKQVDIKNVRCFVMGNYSLYYTIDSLKINIVTFWDNRQDPETLDTLLSEF